MFLHCSSVISLTEGGQKMKITKRKKAYAHKTIANTKIIFNRVQWQTEKTTEIQKVYERN